VAGLVAVATGADSGEEETVGVSTALLQPQLPTNNKTIKELVKKRRIIFI
jgi:hypothetical protein